MTTEANVDAHPYQADRAYSFDDAATALTISKRTLCRQVEGGKIRAVRVSERRRAIPGAELLRVLREGVAL